MSNPEIDWAKPQRQAPAAIVMILVKVLTGILKIIWPLFVIQFFKSKDGGLDKSAILALIVTIISFVGSLFEYFYFRFFIVNRELVIKKGIFVRKIIKLPLEKIQAVHVQRGWLHKILAVSGMVFDSSGSEEAEAKIDAIDQRRLTAIRNLILEQGNTLEASQGLQAFTGEQIVSLGGKDLLKLCLSANHLKVFFLLLVFSYTALENVGVSGKEYGRVWQWMIENIQTDKFRLFLILTVSVMLVAILVSFIRILLSYIDFEVRDAAKGLHISGGLINRKEKFIPFRKIQFISWEANWFRRRLGIYMLHYRVVGNELTSYKLHVKVPVTQASFIPVLSGQYQLPLAVKEIKPVRISKRFIRHRLLWIGIVPVIVAFPLLYYYFEGYSFFLLLWLLFSYVNAVLFQHRFRLWLDEQALQLKKGVFGTEELILRWDHIQSIKRAQSIYQRKYQLATVQIQTAGGGITLPFIEWNMANQIMNFALYKVENSTEPCM